MAHELSRLSSPAGAPTGPELRDIGYQFEPPCYEPIPPGVLTQGTCAGEW
eukprot:COSAG01_NODE_31_length_35900_cov_44.332169_4_plen_50_part_00